MATEKRLIDANAVLEDYWARVNCGEIMTYQDIHHEIKRAPTVDAVEVVRCKDCKHWHEETGWCALHSHFIGRDGMACHPSQSSEWKMFDANDFCSYGERRTDG